VVFEVKRLREKSSGAPVVRIARGALADMRAHARAELPNECCGLLVGDAAGVVRSIRARNRRKSPTRYLIDPRDHFSAIRAARAAGLAVIGAYHSHPSGPAVPSMRDLAEAHDRSYVYVIVSPAEKGDTRGFRFSGSAFEPVDLEVARPRRRSSGRCRARRA
jgi:proteasome lid subunit RPN8/RPN11